MILQILISFNLMFLISAAHFPVPRDKRNLGTEGWLDVAQEELEASLKKEKLNKNVAKNVILFIGDGMGLSTIWASRIYIGQRMHGQSGEEYQMSFEKFDHVALSKVYTVDNQVPDSAATATAFLSGVKNNFFTIGVNEHVKEMNCSNVKGNEVNSILDWSLAKGKSVGVVTSTTVTHATPGAAYAHTPNRMWESDTDFNDPANQPYGNINYAAYNKKYGCKDIALQLVEDNYDINVVLGGGRRNFFPKTMTDPEYSSKTGERSDGRDLVEEWKMKHGESKTDHAYVWNKSQLNAVDTSEVDYLFGLFEPGHMPFELERNKATDPSLADMTRKAIEVLQKNHNGFFLLVEAGRIDHAHHYGIAKTALHDTYALDEAVKEAIRMTSDYDTLVVVTADHSHTLTAGGYPTRGNDVLGIVDRELAIMPILDDMPYLTLSYSNGLGAEINKGRRNITNDNFDADDYKQQATVPLAIETHSGEDVAIYAHGPMAHLFSGVHEQNYIALVMGYASCVGPNQEHCDREELLPPRASASAVWNMAAVSTLAWLCFLILIFGV